jgi:hypothetical protein
VTDAFHALVMFGAGVIVIAWAAFEDALHICSRSLTRRWYWYPSLVLVLVWAGA